MFSRIPFCKASPLYEPLPPQHFEERKPAAVTDCEAALACMKFNIVALVNALSAASKVALAVVTALK
jgi:hypothetical protein